MRGRLAFAFSLVVFAASCADPERASNPSAGKTDSSAPVPAATDSVGFCRGICDASPPSVPVVSDSGGWGDVTSYGGSGNKVPSSGGACNYGATGIYRFAAIQVSRLPGDLQGQWNSGRICGQCAKVQARTATGWKSTIVRIVDKCPDDACGIDLGGAPATDLMGGAVGRYSGRWSFVDCPADLDGISDGGVSLHVKEGSNPWWSLVQVRDPPAAVDSILVRKTGAMTDSVWSLAWATEAENFFRVPRSILVDSQDVELEFIFRNGTRRKISVPGNSLSVENADLPL